MVTINLIPSFTCHFRHILRKTGMMFMLLALSGCVAGVSEDLRQSLSVMLPKDIDFGEIHYYAQRSESAYKSLADIRETYPLVIHATTVQPANVRYFIETDPTNRTQTLSVRGTAERLNVIEDIEATLIPDSILGIVIHEGFQDDANAILDDARPHLHKGFRIRITGHSLGGAVAAILGLYLEKEGYTVARVVTFGQPRFSTEKLKAEALSDTIRVVHNNDIVPMLPPGSIFGDYVQISAEVILREGSEYIYLEEHDTERLSVGFFWRNMTSASLSDHHMGGYLSNIQTKIDNGGTQVPYLRSDSAAPAPIQ